MRKLTLFLLSLCFSFLVMPAHAEDRQNLRDTRIENREEVREVKQENREEVRELRQENRQEIRSDIASNHALRLERRFHYYYSRLNGIATRIEKRLTTLKTEGKDTSSAEAKLAEAKTKLESAKTLGEEAITTFRSLDPAKFSEQKVQIQSARALADSARLAFSSALTSLKSVLQEVK